MSLDDLFRTELQKQIASMIIQFPDLGDAEIAERTIKKDGGHPARSYVAKVRKALGVTPTEEEAHEAIIDVEKELEEEVEEEEEEEEEEYEEEAIEEEPPVRKPLVEEDRLELAFRRSLKRLTDRVIQVSANLTEGTVTDEEATDLQIGLVAIIGKYGHVALQEYYPEGTVGCCLGGILLNVIKRRREQKEKEKPLPPPPPTETPQEEKPPETEQPKVFKKGETTPQWMKGSILEDTT